MKVRCPKCGEEFEIIIPVIEVPKDKVFIHEESHKASPEATRIWEKRKKQLTVYSRLCKIQLRCSL